MTGQQKYNAIPHVANSGYTHLAPFGGGSIACKDGSIGMDDARFGCCEMISPFERNDAAFAVVKDSKDVTFL